MTDLEARLIRLERVVENQSLAELVGELERLRSESAALRGELETLRFETENSDSRQRELYVDLDRRLNGLESAPRSFNPPAVDPPGPRATPAEAEAPAAVASRPAGSDQQNYTAALDLIESRRYDEANRAFTAFLASFPTSPLADNAQYWLAETHYVRNQYAEGLTQFRRLIETYPQSVADHWHLDRMSTAALLLLPSALAVGALLDRWRLTPRRWAIFATALACGLAFGGIS
jgi:TolA-binding protein